MPIVHSNHIMGRLKYTHIIDIYYISLTFTSQSSRNELVKVVRDSDMEDSTNYYEKGKVKEDTWFLRPDME